MRIIRYDENRCYLRTRFLRTIACNDCGKGASLILEGDKETVRSRPHEQFLHGVLHRLMVYRCTCDWRDGPEPDAPWVEGWLTERFK